LDRIVSADNGPASARLAKAVEDDLLRREPYRSLGLDVDTVMGSGDSRVWSDLVSLSDRTWGWDADLAVLRAAGFEAIRAHPLRYLHGVASTWKTAFRNNLTPGPTQVSTDRRRGPEELATFRPHGQRVIPFSFQDYRGSRPGGPSHDQPRDEPQVGWWSVPYGTLHGSVRDGSPGVARFLNDVVTDLYPPMYVFVLLGFAGVFLCPHPARWVMLFIAGLALGHVLIVYAIEHVVLEYRTAFDAVFILLGVAGFTRNGLGYRLRREAG
jgi:hypothetical protein